MNLKSKWKFIKKQDNNKSTVIVLVLLSLVVFVSFSFSRTVNNYLESNNEFDYYYYFGGYLTHEDDAPNLREAMDKLKKVKYVKDVFSTEESEYIVRVDKVGDRNVDGYVRLIGKTEEELKKLSNNNYRDKYSIVCHKNYYPDIDHEVNNWIPRSKFISMEEYKGSTMSIHYTHLTSKVRYNDNLNIVEILKNDDVKIDENICYASRELMWEVYKKEFDGVNGDDFLESFLVEYDVNHYEEVNAEFNKLGFWVSNNNRYVVDYTLSDFIVRLKLVLLVGSIIVIGIFVSIFNKNKLIDKTKSYSTLKTIGMNDKEYNNLLDLESILIVIKSLIFSIIASLIICLIIALIRYMFPFFLMKIYIKFDWLSLMIYYLSVLILLCLTNYVYFKKIKSKSIVENLGE